ncbi:uncharacterized protein A1O9_02559, partial [Exophiala aquamarina CBS 119918]
WKVLHHSELEKWTNGYVALLDDVCHPTLPRQSQGATIAVEDGAVLGVLLGILAQSQYVAEILRLYEKLQKSCLTVNFRGAAKNGRIYQLPDGLEQAVRDGVFA